MLRCNNGKFLLLGILAVLWMDDSGGFVTLPASNPEFVIRSARGTSLWAAEIARKPAVEVTKAFAFPTNRQQTQHQYLARMMTNRENMAVEEWEEAGRFMGSRRLAAVGRKICDGADAQGGNKLMGSRRLAEAKDLVLNAPRDKKRLLGSRRLSKAREALLQRLQNEEGEGPATLLGSKRLARAREAIKLCAADKNENGSLIRCETSSSKVPTHTTEAAKLLYNGREATAAYARVDRNLSYLGKPATVAQQEQVAAIRGFMVELSSKEREEMSDWIDELEDVDILRYVLGFPGATTAWGKIKDTARWRKAEQIDKILDEDMSKIFEEGGEEILYLPPDQRGRPVLLYRSALHKPGRIDPKTFTRFVTRETERAIKMYKLGRETESAVIVDRVGSGLKNQDIPLLQEILPVILNHYPYTVGAVYIAPVNAAFNIIWAVLGGLINKEAQARFQLLNTDYMSAFKDFMNPKLIPQTLGGELDVSAWLVENRAILAADAQLAELEEHMQGVSAAGGLRRLSYGGNIATEQEIVDIGTIRLNIAVLTPAEKDQLGPWILSLDTIDILRFLRAHPVDKAWECLKRTSKWRKDERIDDILDEDMSNVMEEGKEEFFFAGRDHQERPILVYRSSLHVPGKIDVQMYLRYVIQRVEQGRTKYGLGKDVQCVVLVDRVGSTGSSQDPALLRVLLPCFTAHFPGIIGKIYIAPINSVFFFIWGLASFLFDQATRNNVRLLKGDYTTQLLQTMDRSVLVKSMGGDLVVPESSIF